MLTFGSLFAGIGGFDLGFERAGMVCKWQVEIDEYCRRVLKKHWPDVPRWDDVRTFPPEGEWGVDVICGGFPCQDISYAGRGAGLEGERSGLFFEAVRVVQQLRPRILVLENVAAILGRGLDVVLGTLAEIGFDAEWHCIPAAAFGASHIRDRAFILAYGSGERFSADLLASGKVVCQREVAEKSGWNGKPQRPNWRLGDAEYPPPPDDERWARGTQTRWKPPCCERGVHGATHGIPGGVDRARAVGNSVCPQVAEWIGRRIVESVG